MSRAKQDAYHKIHIPAATKPSGCPIDHDFTPFNPEYLRDPYPQLQRFSADEQGVVAQATNLDEVVEYRFDGAEVCGTGSF